jgi:hypothetical protein
MMLPISIEQLVNRFDAPFVRSIVLMGSYARGEAGTYSDIDIVRFIDGMQQTDSSSFLVDGHLVVVSNVTPEEVERWFNDPEMATSTIVGVRRAIPLLDRKSYFAGIQERAAAFQWDQIMQERADQWASTMMVGLIEEVHKGLAGLQKNDIGRLLNARYGLSWSLSRVIRVQQGIFISGDNGFYDAVIQAMEPHPEWGRLLRTTFGIESDEGKAPTLYEQVRAGLQLYILTAEILGSALKAEDRPLVTHTVELIHNIYG